MSNEVVKYTWNDEELTLTKKDVRELIATSPNVTDREIERFMALCKYRHLNPFLREAYLIKYGNDPAQNVTGIETFTKRAAKNKNYNGFIPRNNYDETKNKMDWWSEVEIHLANLKFPIIKRVYYEEYVGTKKDGSITKMWRTKPRTMLDKVALMQGLRLALPEEFGGLYEESELDQQGEPNFKDVTPNQKPEPTEPEEEPVEEAEVEEEIDPEVLTDKQSAFVKKNFLSSSYLTEDEKKKYTKEFNEGMTKTRASELIYWWIGDKQKGIIGERQKREEEKKVKEVQDNMKEAGLVKDEKESDEEIGKKLEIIDMIKGLKKQKYITAPQFKKMAYGKDVKELDKLTLEQLHNVLNKVETYQNKE